VNQDCESGISPGFKEVPVPKKIKAKAAKKVVKKATAKKTVGKAKPRVKKTAAAERSGGVSLSGCICPNKDVCVCGARTDTAEDRFIDLD
jgi:hypothetical protein